MRSSEMQEYRLAGVSFSHSTEAKIWNFRNLLDGWHCGEGVQFRDRDLLDAIELHSEMLNCGFFETDAFPGFNGEIQITIYSGGDYFEFTLETNGKWAFVHERGEEEVQCKELLTFSEAIKIVRDLAEKQLWNTSAFFHVGIGTGENLGFKACLSSLHLQMEEFPFSTSSVPFAEAEAFVDISDPFTITYQMSPQYFGNFQTPYFRKGLHLLTKSATVETNATETSPD
jgi:hypothetical protein